LLLLLLLVLLVVLLVLLLLLLTLTANDACLQRPKWSAVRWLLVDGVSGEVLQVGGVCG
jgi:D-alanyl-D-alanine carboxypeptidase